MESRRSVLNVEAASYNPAYLINPIQQEFGEKRSVLAVDASDERSARARFVWTSHRGIHIRFNPQHRQQDHAQQQPAVPTTLDVDASGRALPIPEGQIDDLQIVLCSSEHVEIAEWIEISLSTVAPFTDVEKLRDKVGSFLPNRLD